MSWHGELYLEDGLHRALRIVLVPHADSGGQRAGVGVEYLDEFLTAGSAPCAGDVLAVVEIGHFTAPPAPARGHGAPTIARPANGAIPRLARH
ncbi:hypothetical protein SDC9_138689 [bioreactor metagenome]|uniref:Uncharacterized protein n=1 Tax=bioreactor metagenome TaxID=1076179 RepID=A0A645DQZ6_9ZZZZ